MAGFKIDIQQSMVFLYTGKDQLDIDRKGNHSVLYQCQKMLWGYISKKYAGLI